MTDSYTEQLSSEDVSVGDEGPTLIIENVQREDFVKYAGASGDFDPLHYDEPYAKAAGNEMVFAQGMLTAGFGTEMAAKWFGLANIREVEVRFEARVFPGETVETSGVVTEVDGSTVEAELTSTISEDDKTVLTGTVVADLPE